MKKVSNINDSLGWIIGIIFGLVGVLEIFIGTHLIAGFLFIILAIIFLPPTERYLKLSQRTKIILAIILFIIAGSLIQI